MLRIAALTAALLALAAGPAHAVVGGHDAAPGAYPSVAEVHIAGLFLCTGTLISPDTVITAGHCGSPTGEVVAVPVGWPAQLIDVRIGSVTPGAGESATVARVVVEPKYLATQGYDVTLLKLAAPSGRTPTPVAGPGETALWAPGVSETIAGFGTTTDGGDTARTLQEAAVPRLDDATCAAQVGGFDASTMLCAGFPQGGVDTCQGDSGGPMFGRTAAGALRLVGATSFGEGCAKPGKPGVYARVAADPLRSWIASEDPDAVAAGPATVTGSSGAAKKTKTKAKKKRKKAAVKKTAHHAAPTKTGSGRSAIP